MGIDIETYSSAPLPKCGVYRYTDAPDFEVLLFSYAYDDEPVVTIDLACGETLPSDVIAALNDPTIIKVAYNAQFERVCLSRHLGRWLDPRQWRCTAVMAAYLTLPSRLADVAVALKLSQQKMEEEMLNSLFDSVPGTLSELIRTAFIPKEGCRFIVADFSAIEARVLAWLAGEDWVLDEFRGKGKIYEATASRMFHIPQETIVKGHPNYEYRQKGKQATLSCGYGGGVGALKAMGAKMPEEEMQPLVDAWRAANPNIVAFWNAMDRAARKVIRKQEAARVGKVTLYWQDDKMLMRLPSGRNLCYQSPHFTMNRFGSDAIGYYAPNSAGQMVEQETFGGKLAENATQAIARDILAHAMLNLDAAGYPIVFHGCCG